MKENKNYITKLLISQMIFIPIIITASIIIFNGVLMDIIDKWNGEWLGRDGQDLIYILVTFFSILIIGAVVGYIFSMKCKDKPNSVKDRYIPAFFPVAYAIFFTALAILFSKGNYNSGWWEVYAFKNPFFILIDFGLAFLGMHFIMPVLEIAGYIGFVIGLLLQEGISKTSIVDKPGRNLMLKFALVCIISVLCIYISAKGIIDNGIIELQYGKATIKNELTEFDLLKIAPFKEKNGLAKLDKKASLQFKNLEEMPRLDGATAAYPVYGAFVEAVYTGLGDYYRENKDKEDKEAYEAFVSSKDYPFSIVQCSKTAEAYERLMNKETDIIFVAEPSKAQVEKIKAKGDEFVLTPIGSEAFVFFTNSNNPVENLSIKEIQDIYSGKIRSWKDVNGENARILPYQRPEDSGSQTIMQNKVMKGIKMLQPNKETYAGGMGEIIQEVASYKNAKNSIGYSFMYYSSSMIKNNQIKYISINGIKPTAETVRSKKYPFAVPVYAVTLKSNSNRNIPKLIDWILSEEGQSLIEKTGYVRIK